MFGNYENESRNLHEVYETALNALYNKEITPREVDRLISGVIEGYQKITDKIKSDRVIENKILIHSIN